MIVHLNIGLASQALGFVAANTVLQALANHGFFVRTSEALESDTEPTLIVVADWGLTTYCKVDVSLADAVHKVAELTGQDCIATWLPERKEGRLIGPRAAAWGAFNPEFFITPSGDRLATPLQNAA